ncbi:zinc-ribbon domain-containing protein [Clostridium neuense]|uniref:Zinc-ribbon domain-containing protein n=1 Tax=Clostridium neuense TaxID=1728934 RepID=A0ABW8TL21_9CLOT
MIFCTKCVNKLKDGARFCDKYGAPARLKIDVQDDEKIRLCLK